MSFSNETFLRFLRSALTSTYERVRVWVIFGGGGILWYNGVCVCGSVKCVCVCLVWMVYPAVRGFCVF